MSVAPPTDTDQLRVQSTPDHQAEAILRERGITWTFVERVVPSTSTFDYAASLQNQARPGELDEPTVIKYTEALKNGSSLPAIVVWRDKKTGLFIVAGGNHRLESYTRARLPLNLYLLPDGLSKQVTLELTFALNAINGLPTSERTRVTQGIALMEVGASAAEAGRTVLIRPQKLRDEWAKRQYKVKAINAGIKPHEWDAMEPSTRDRIQSMRTHEGYVGMMRLAIDAGLTFEEVKELITQINTSDSGDQQRSVIQDLTDNVYRGRIEAGGKKFQPSKGKRSTPRTLFDRTLTLIIRMQKAEEVAPFYNPVEVDEVAARIDQSIEKLRAYKKAITKNV